MGNYKNLTSPLKQTFMQIEGGKHTINMLLSVQNKEKSIPVTT
jgi:hypothetical protein